VIISLIVAMDERRGIGKDNQLPWHLSSDLKRFKKLTMGHHLVMGRKTYETIGKPLSGRVTIIISHQKDYSAPGCLVVNSLAAAIKLAVSRHEDELFIIGGGEIFKQAMGLVDKIYLTTVQGDFDADIVFPNINLDQWKILIGENGIKNEADEYRSDFKILIRQH
jgi:dihydrofolate reductase